MATGVRIARRRDIPALAGIWRLCFHDPDDYISFFYDENFDRMSVFVYTVDDRPVSMVHTMDAGFVNGGERHAAKFLYAGGTHPDFRGRGYYGEIFASLREWADRNDYTLFGKPATKSLVPLYSGFGLEPDACLRLVNVEPDGKAALTFSPLTPHEYNSLRNAAFGAGPHAEWSDSHVRWSFAENEWFGGKTLALNMDDGGHFLMCAPAEDSLIINETDLTLPQLQRACAALCETSGASKLKAYLPDFACSQGEEIISSIVYNSPFKNTYVNLIML